MKISEFIKVLERAKKKYGDVEVWVSHEWTAPVTEVITYSPEQNLDDYPEYFPEKIMLDVYGEYDHRGEWKKRRK